MHVELGNAKSFQIFKNDEQQDYSAFPLLL